MPDEKIKLNPMSKMQIRIFTTGDLRPAYRKRKTDDYIGKIFTLMDV